MGGTEERASAASSEQLTPAQPVSAQPVSAQPVSAQPVSAQPVSAQPVSAHAEQLAPELPEAAAAPEPPTIRVVSGQPSAEELAALVAVLSAVGSGAAATTEPEWGRSAWSDPAWRLSGPQPRRGGWRSSSLPR